jgi:hypothetical protein
LGRAVGLTAEADFPQNLFEVVDPVLKVAHLAVGKSVPK